MTSKDDKKIIEELLQQINNQDLSQINSDNIDIEQLVSDFESSENSPPINFKNLNFLTKNEQCLQEILGHSKGPVFSEQQNNLDEMINTMGLEKNAQNKQPPKKEIIIPEFNNPIDFINYMETVYVKSRIEENEHIFQIKNYKLHSKIDYSVLQFTPKTTLSSRFFKNGNLITSIAGKGDLIFTGNNLGEVRMYSCSKEYEYKSLYLNEIKTETKKSVVCMDISDNLNYLAVGYLNGFVALWELSSSKCKRLVKDAHIKSSVVAIKFLKVENKYYEILTSDLKGSVKKIAINDGFFFSNVDIIKVMEYKIPIFLIDYLRLTIEEKKQFYEKKDDPIIIAFGCLEYVLIYQLEPETKKLFMFERPKYLNNDSNKYPIPDVSFGIGYCPKEYADSDEIDKSKIQRLISISWGRVLYLFCLTFDKTKGPSKVIPLGHYVNNSQILRMGFLSKSIIFLYDIHKNFTIINTSLICSQELKIDPLTQKPVSSSYKGEKPEVENKKQIDQDISLQAYIPDRGSKEANATKATYNNIIINQLKCLFILGKKSFFYGKLINWEECLSSLQQKSEWLNALSLGLDIYHGKNTSLPDIPIDENERKLNVGYVLKGLILQYATINIGNDYSQISIEKGAELLSSCINICIEFCLEINDVEYLLNQIQPIFDIKGYLDLFIEKLEPFILCDKIKDQQFGHLTISKIINLYIEKKKIYVLSQLLTHLDIQCIDSDDIKKICVDNNLITPLIYIYMNGKNEDYFFPIQKMYEMFNKFSPIPQSKLSDYSTCLNYVSFVDLEKSKQYIGHKLLWYINLCLSKKKFPSNSPIPDKKFNHIVIDIFFWLMKNQIISELMNFDSFGLFSVLTRFFTEEPLLNLIKKEKYNKEKCKNILLYGEQIMDYDIKTFVDIIIDKAERVKKIYALFDMNLFITKISCKVEIMDKKQIMGAAKYLLEFPNKKEQAMREEDPFPFHKKFWNSENFENNLSNDIKEMISCRRDKLEESDLLQLLTISGKSSFVLVKIFLLIQTGNYPQCLNTYLFEPGIENRAKKTFDFINTSLKELTEKNKKDLLRMFEEEVLSKYPQLASLSITELTKINRVWFDNNHTRAIEKLSKKEYQLEYVETILEEYKEDELASEKIETDTYIYLLNMHIDLLCKLNKIDDILPNLKKRPAYPIDCLPKCLEAKAYDAAIYLYNTTGKIDESFNLSVKLLRETVDELKKCIKIKAIDKYTKLIRVHRDNLDRCIKICKDNSDKSDIEDTEKMWFNLLELFYSTLNDVKEIKVQGSEEMENDIQVTLSSNIKLILNTMNSYVSIKKIIEFVTSQQAEYKEFKGILKTMLFSYTLSNNILYCTKNLLKNLIKKTEDEYAFILKKGNYFNLKKCDDCQKNLEFDDKIGIFKCGHQIHLGCCIMEEGKITCPVCRRQEIEDLATSGESSHIHKSGKNEDKNLNNLQHSKSEKQNNQLKEKMKEKIIFDKLKSLDKKFLEMYTLVK